MKPSTTTVAFLGPEGTFAHLAAKNRFGEKSHLMPCPSIKEVFDYVARDGGRIGIVPIENSSGGQLQDTVDCLLEKRYDGLFIRESLAVNVRLALMGRSKDKIKVIYSHFAPLHHCEAWLDKHLPDVRREEVSSTARAVQQASKEKGAAAIGNRMAGKIYNLEVLEFPIQDEIENVTQFFVFGHEPSTYQKTDRMTLLATLRNVSGSLVDFLEPFSKEGINLTRIISRPIPGSPETYAFLADIEGSPTQRNVQRAIKKVESQAKSLRVLGAYPVRERYDS
jgi:chorismate mutase / prephenate dehydratase